MEELTGVGVAVGDADHAAVDADVEADAEVVRHKRVFEPSPLSTIWRLRKTP